MAEQDSSTHSERWADVIGFEGLYRVSDQGRVWSYPSTYTRHEWRKGNPQTVHVGGNFLIGHVRRRDGRPVCVLLSMSDASGKKYTKRVHRLVLEAFVGPAPKGMVCCHWNGDPTDNRLSNLRWDTPKANQSDSVRHGTKAMPPTFFGERHHHATLNKQQVAYIRRQIYKRGMYNQLARELGVSGQTIRRIYLRESRASKYG